MVATLRPHGALNRSLGNLVEASDSGRESKLMGGRWEARKREGVLEGRVVQANGVRYTGNR